jgi:hypothetical protein
MFFPPEAAPMVLARWRDQIGAKDTKAGLAAVQLCRISRPELAADLHRLDVQDLTHHSK